jgi:hypothetical protein
MALHPKNLLHETLDGRELAFSDVGVQSGHLCERVQNGTYAADVLHGWRHEDDQVVRIQGEPVTQGQTLHWLAKRKTIEVLHCQNKELHLLII